jgi:hypothetical protein
VTPDGACSFRVAYRDRRYLGLGQVERSGRFVSSLVLPRFRGHLTYAQ